MKPRILVLTDYPRLLCLKEGSHSIHAAGDGVFPVPGPRIRIKSEVVFGDDGEESAIVVGESGSAPNATSVLDAAAVGGIRGRTGFPSRSRTRTRTMSSSTGKRPAGVKEVDLLKSVEGKGDRSFVIQTDGKLYTYIADDQALASRWVREIKAINAPGSIHRSRDNGGVK